METAESDEAAQKLKQAEKPDLKGDRWNFLFLLLLYVLQGVPQGMSYLIPILLQKRGVSYTGQAGYSISYYPFSLKILWAPIVDSVYVKSFGRRKTWICSAQMLTGIFMIFTSYHVDEWMEGSDGGEPRIPVLTVIFFTLWFLVSTQDIAVDGYGLTLLQRKNVGYAATANSVGQNAGSFIGYALFLIFESKDFCNTFIFSEPRERGLFTFSGFLLFWGVSYMLITTFIAMFKKEEEDEDRSKNYGIKQAYPVIFEIVKLKPVIQLCTVVCTISACFSAYTAIGSLKFIEYGVPRENLAMVSSTLVPIVTLLPLFITNFTAGRKPLSFYYKLFPFRVVAMLLLTFYIYHTEAMLENITAKRLFYVGLFLLYLFNGLLRKAAGAADGSFFAKIADPLVGGTYMTVINTFSNLGGSISTTLTLWFVDKITWKRCDYGIPISLFNSTEVNACVSASEKEACAEEGGSCQMIVDGFYIEIGINVLIAIFWYKLAESAIKQLQRYPREAWYVLTKESEKSSELEPMRVVEE